MMQPYDTYKDSGIDWVERIPNDWKTIRLAVLGSFYKGKGVAKSDIEMVGNQVILYGDIYTKYSLSVDSFERRIPDEVSKKSFLIKSNDLLFTASGETKEEIGKALAFQGEDEAYAGGDVIIFRQNEIDAKYLSYLFNSYKIAEQKAKLSKGEIVVHIYSSQLRDIKFPLPENNVIENLLIYLDQKTEQIDRIIKAKQKLIQLYEEDKQLIINELVTGKKVLINGKLELPKKTKDSETKWLGRIPEDWSHSSLKWYSKIYSGGTPSKSVLSYWFAGDIPWLNSGTVNQFIITEPSNYITEEGLNNSSAKWIPKGALVMALAGQGKTKGMVGMVTFKTTCNQSLGVIVPNSKVNNKFLLYYLNDNYQNIRNLAGGDKRDGINLEMIGGIKIPLPDIEIQEEVVTSIEEKLSHIDFKIQNSLKLISLLKEYRTTLINDVVTGKIKIS